MRAVVGLFRHPALHFAVLGGVLFVLVDSAPPGAPRPTAPGRTIVLNVADVDRLRGEWTKEHGVAPAPTEERALIAAAIDEEVLYREALRLGLDRDDPLVRSRLVQLARYLGEGPIEDEATLERDARALGLDRTDLVLRRHLVQAARLLAAGPQQAELPTEAALEAYLAQHADAFAQPPRMRFVHVYLSAERRRETLGRDAGALAAQLRAGHVGPAEASVLGDPFPRGAVVPLVSASDVDGRFGPGFGEALEDAPLHTWVGPMPSTYGLHLVWMQERVPARTPSLVEIRGQVVHRLLRERREERVRTAVAALRRRYDIRVDAGVPPPPGGSTFP